MSFHVPEHARLITGRLGSDKSFGNNGAFVIHYVNCELFCIASDGKGWEHVSVSLTLRRCPNWPEMSYVKKLFWDSKDCVIQYHPPEIDYINNVQNCLHLWRPSNFLTRYLLPRPNKNLVGVK